MSVHIKIKKGLDIPISGSPSETITKDSANRQFAICPDDFNGVKWKIRVKEEDKVKIGTTLFSDKDTGRICITSPVAGKIGKIKRGERRKVEYVEITTSDITSENDIAEGFSAYFNDNGQIPASFKDLLLKSGIWVYLRQRPYDIIPSPDTTPRDIYVTAFDSAPLAAPMVVENDKDDIIRGLDALSTLTTGKVWIGIRNWQNLNYEAGETIIVDGPHPAGNPGVQIANTKPVNKGETVWTLDVTTAARIGRMLRNHYPDFKTRTAITGPMIKNPHIVETYAGASLKTLLDGKLKKHEENIRIISGNVLTGTHESIHNGFLRFPYRQVTVIKEGNTRDEFMGWASMNPDKYSVKRTFPAFFRKGHLFDFDARVKGGHRAMILSGEYDKVFPFDIYPEYLVKAIENGDIDKMEKLGIYEVAPEDFALPEFVDTSKIALQDIVRKGLDNLRTELGE